MNADKIIIEPLLTEKSNILRESKKYCFKVHKKANKIQIKKAIKELFHVSPLTCNIINEKPKPKRVRYKKGYTAEWKKAIVTIRPEETISIFEGA